MKKTVFLYSLVIWKYWGTIAVLPTCASSTHKHTQAVFTWSSTQHGQLPSSLINLNANKTKPDDGNWSGRKSSHSETVVENPEAKGSLWGGENSSSP